MTDATAGQNSTGKTPITLDHNGQIPVSVERIGLDVQFSIDLSSLEMPDKLGGDGGHFQEGLKLVADGQALPAGPIYRNKKLEFKTELPPECRTLTLTCYDQPVLTFTQDLNGAFVADPAHRHERLTVDELRMIADYDKRPDRLPFDRSLFKGFDPAKHAPITDLHTHSSAQLSAHDLVELAVKKNLDYPLELLGKLGVTDLSMEEAKAIKFEGGLGARFSPLEHENLACEQQNKPCDVIPVSALSDKHRATLEAQLKVNQDRIICFSDFDKQYYRYVNPLVKNPAITHEMILQIARDYAHNGVKYAELSTASMLNLDPEGQATWFKEMIEAVKDAKAETGVDLRFLISIPRSYTSGKVMAEMEKIKFAARHPLIAGVDLVGYEYNRTSNFTAMLAHIADWARAPEMSDEDKQSKTNKDKLDPDHGWDFKRDFTIRIHAGETRKNNGNVAEAVRIADKYGIHVRIAHAVNEKTDKKLDATIQRLSADHPPLVSIEFNPSSNLAYNNVQDVREVPYRRWLKVCKSWFLGSDGAGAIQTTPTQLALSALAAGVSLDELAHMRKTEERFVSDQEKNVAAKTAAYTKHYEHKYQNGKSVDENFLDEFAARVSAIGKLLGSKLPAKLSVQEKKVAITQAKLEEINSKLKGLAAGRGLPEAPTLPEEFDGKMPILVAGASGDSIEGVNPKTQQEIKRAVHMLVATADPDKVYFVLGRSKSEGVTAALDEAILEHNEKNPKHKFKVLALITHDTPDLPHSQTWPVEQKGNIDSVPDNIINFMRAQLHKDKIPGFSIFIGGSSFTGDMIRKCKDADGRLDYLVMENAPGASMDFAKKLHNALHFDSGKSLLYRMSKRLEKRGADIFRHTPDIHLDADLAKLETDAKRRYPSNAALRTDDTPSRLMEH